MVVVTISSSAARTSLGPSSRFSTSRRLVKRSLVVAFKADKSETTALVAPCERIVLPVERPKEKGGRGNTNKNVNRVESASTEHLPSSLEVDYNEAAAKLENLYKLSPETYASNDEKLNGLIKEPRKRKRKTSEDVRKLEKVTGKSIVRNRSRKPKRMSLEKRIELMKSKEEEVAKSTRKKKDRESENEKIDELVREYSASTDLVSSDWKKMKIPPVLPFSEHYGLFKLMQPMKALVKVKENLKNGFGREPTDVELAEATNMDVVQVRRTLEVGRAARNKLIKHNLRLVLFVVNKYFQDFANGPKFQDLCQAGVKGLITAIDRFESKRRLKLSTYGLFWIRHAIIRSMTQSSFTRVPFGLESVRVEIQKAKLELQVELNRQPTEEEIIDRVGISPKRYHEVMRASKSVASLNSRNATTQEELINAITDVDGGDNRRQPALLRLALDDVLDSLKPKESLVIRQRYGLDGKGDRTLGEIAGNLNISREMVRKHEVKALMKLNHPARVDYLRRYVV